MNQIFFGINGLVDFLKKAKQKMFSDSEEDISVVSDMLREIEVGGEKKAEDFSRRLDKYFEPIKVTKDQMDEAEECVSDILKDDINYARKNVEKFALAQKKSINSFQTEILPGLIAGQKMIPVKSAGCYVPGGRYSHIASAIMTVTTAKVAGVKHITVCSPPRDGKQIPNEIIFAAKLCGANEILTIGGVQGVASLAFGFFGVPPSDIIVGPGNQFVAQAKKLLFGRVGIDLIAGPTDSLIIADGNADPLLVATDLVSQAEHGYNSPVCLLSDDRKLCEDVMKLVSEQINSLPEFNKNNAAAAWNDYGQVIICENRDIIVEESEKIAPEHLSIHANDLEWWLDRLTSYGSLFLGEETTVSFDLKSS